MPGVILDPGGGSGDTSALTGPGNVGKNKAAPKPYNADPMSPFNSTDDLERSRAAGKLNGQAFHPGGNQMSAPQQQAQSGGKNQPAPPDYTAAAHDQATQSAANVTAQTQANRPNQTNAWGTSSNWGQNPDGTWSQNVSLSPEMQGIQQQLMGQMRDAYSQPFDNGSAARQQAIDSAYGQSTSRLNPQWDQRQEQMGAQLANQGLDPNSQAYQTALRQFGQDRNDAYSSAMNDAVGQGNQAQALTFAQNMAARNAPLQGLQGLQGFMSMPNFQGSGMADPMQSLAAMMAGYNAQLGAWQAQQKATTDAIGAGAQTVGAIGSLAGGG